MRIFDLHCDTLIKLSNNNYSISCNNGHISDRALQMGGYMSQCFAIYTSQKFVGEKAYEHFKNQYKIYNDMLKTSNILISDFEKNSRDRKVSAILTIENAEFLNGNLERINEVKVYGVKIFGLIHNGENCLGYPHTINNAPLKQFGKNVIDYLNYTDIYCDVSHLNCGGFDDVISISKKPVIATHSACREVCEHSRNLYDNQIKAIGNTGGIIGIPFYSQFLNRTNKTEINDLLNHINHLINHGGEDITSLGTDFDGMECNLFLKDCSEMQILADAIVKKFGNRIAEKICFKNALRLLG